MQFSGLVFFSLLLLPEVIVQFSSFLGWILVCSMTISALYRKLITVYIVCYRIRHTKKMLRGSGTCRWTQLSGGVCNIVT